MCIENWGFRKLQNSFQKKTSVHNVPYNKISRSSWGSLWSNRPLNSWGSIITYGSIWTLLPLISQQPLRSNGSYGSEGPGWTRLNSRQANNSRHTSQT